MKNYTGSMLHGCNKPNPDEKPIARFSFDLGMIPEEVMQEKVQPLINELADILSEFHIYIWSTRGYYFIKEENTENKL